VGLELCEELIEAFDVVGVTAVQFDNTSVRQQLTE
jgi:hypothetical protein